MLCSFLTSSCNRSTWHTARQRQHTSCRMESHLSWYEKRSSRNSLQPSACRAAYTTWTSLWVNAPSPAGTAVLTLHDYLLFPAVFPVVLISFSWPVQLAKRHLPAYLSRLKVCRIDTLLSKILINCLGNFNSSAICASKIVHLVLMWVSPHGPCYEGFFHCSLILT